MSADDVADLGPELDVAALVMIEESIVLVRRGHGPAGGVWDLPGGHVRRGEALAEALARTVGECLDATVLCGPFLNWIEDPSSDAPSVRMCFEGVLLDPVEGFAAGRREGPGHLAEVSVFEPWDVTEVPLADGVAEFLAELEVIDLVV